VSLKSIKSHYLALILVLSLVMLLSACLNGEQADGITPAGILAPSPTADADLDETDVAAERSSTTPPAPTAPLLAAPPTITSQPTAVIPPTATAAPAPIPGQIGPDNFPEDVNPLTGVRVQDPAVLNRRPLAVKVANGARVRPQAGLNRADLIFEHYSEGGITRFTVIFYTNTPQRVGSIRSGRLIDLEIPIMYDAAFAYSGSSYQIKEMIRESTFFERVISPDFGDGGFWRTFDDKNPSTYRVDNLFTNTIDLRQMLSDRGQERPPNLQNGMTFHPDPPPGGTPVRGVEVIYSGTGILWQYQPGTGRFYRWSDGQRHLDASTGELLNFKNIVIIKAPHFDTEIIEDSGGSPSIQIQIWGEGPAVLFRDGFQYDGIWKRGHPQDMLTFYDLQGEPLPLAPGNTFFELVPLDFSGLAPRVLENDG